MEASVEPFCGFESCVNRKRREKEGSIARPTKILAMINYGDEFIDAVKEDKFIDKHVAACLEEKTE